MNRRLKELDGFVLSDKTYRYKIILPNGWPDVYKPGARSRAGVPYERQ